MTISDDSCAFAKMADASTLVIQRLLPGPAERVWRYLIDSDLRQKWFASGDLDLVPGAPLELVWRNDSLSDTDDERPCEFGPEHRMRSRVVEVDPMRQLKIAWGDGDVTFDLQEEAGRVLLTVTHRGLEDTATRGTVAPGWHAHLDILLAEISGSQRPSFWRSWAKLRTVYDRSIHQEG